MEGCIIAILHLVENRKGWTVLYSLTVEHSISSSARAEDLSRTSSCVRLSITQQALVRSSLSCDGHQKSLSYSECTSTIQHTGQPQLGISHEICDSKKLRGLFQRGSAFQVSTLQRYERTVLICKRSPYPHDRSRTHDGRKRTAAPPASGDLTRGRAGNHDHDQDVADDKAA